MNTLAVRPPGSIPVTVSSQLTTMSHMIQYPQQHKPDLSSSELLHNMGKHHQQQQVSATGSNNNNNNINKTHMSYQQQQYKRSTDHSLDMDGSSSNTPTGNNNNLITGNNNLLAEDTSLRGTLLKMVL